MIIDTLHYYPKRIQEIKEYIRLSAGVDAKLTAVWGEIERITKNMYLDTMDEDTCLMWEKILNITANPLDSLDDRRGRIKGYFASNLPYTEKKIREVLQSMCGEGGYDLVIDTKTGMVDIFIMLSNTRLIDNTYDVIRKMAPADMIVRARIVYNTHSIFRAYTHAELAKYTHYQLRNDQIFQHDHDKHATLGRHKHSELQKYTHFELFEEMI